MTHVDANHEIATRTARRRRCRAVVILAALACAATPAAAAAQGQCAAKMQAALRKIARAESKTLAKCVAQIDEAALGFSVATCAASDPFGLVQKARDRAARDEAKLCAGPAIGFTSLDTVTAAGLYAGTALARGLFGPAVDAALRAKASDAAGARCQRDLLTRSQQCADRAFKAYARCAGKALRRGVTDPFQLVACKPLPDGAQCDADLAKSVGKHCVGLDGAALFPGCAGDLARCARAHAERTASQAVNQAAALCQQVLVGTLPEDTLLRCFAPPAQEPMADSGVIPMPAGVNPQQASWDESGEHLVFNFTSPSTVGNQLGMIRPDGSDFRCLTCATGLITGNLKVAQRFRDGQRLLVAGNNNPNPKWNVLECTPSVLDCQSAVMLPIKLPPNPDPTVGILQYRVPHVTFDDQWFIWSEVRLRGPGGNVVGMGRLVRQADRYDLADPRVIAPPVSSLALGVDSDVWRNFTQPFEAKEAVMRGGLDWVVAGTPEAGHYDNFALDLGSGAVRRMTHYPDHNEGINFSADEQWTVVSSARTDNRVGFLGLLPRPPYVDWIAFSLHFVAIAGAPSDGLSPGGNPNERDCYLDPWMVDRWFERGDYIGQRLLKPADEWQSAAGGFEWSPDGTRLSITELQWRRVTPLNTPLPGRLRVFTLTNRDPIPPAAVVPIVDTPEPTWAIRYQDYVVPNTFGVTVIPGKASGTATITNDFASTLSGSARVDYLDYSDDGASVLNGFEEIRIPVLVSNGAEYSVNLALSGAHHGTMQGDLFYDFVANANTGEVVTTLDGRTLSGPKTCYQAGLIPVP
ncbi:hypothetical protein KF840_14700 [bacterium]|nr:hypothetical protein [bacterium]